MVNNNDDNNDNNNNNNNNNNNHHHHHLYTVECTNNCIDQSNLTIGKTGDT
jgi:hypothetical protein